MSTVTEEVKPEDGKPESEKKIFYCEVCKVPCMSSISLQSHYRGAKHRKILPKTNLFWIQLMKTTFPVLHDMNELSGDLASLKV